MKGSEEGGRNGGESRLAGGEVSLMAGFPSETLCAAKASVDEASAEGEAVLWVGMTAPLRETSNQQALPVDNPVCGKCITSTLPLKQIHFSVLSVKIKQKDGQALFLINAASRYYFFSFPSLLFRSF